MSRSKFDRIIAGTFEPVADNQMQQFEVYCSKSNLSLDKWIEIALCLYRQKPQLCLEFLQYVQKHELSRPIHRDFPSQNAKIAIYNDLASLHLSRAIREPNKEDSDRHMGQAKKYSNSSEKVKMMAGRVYLTLRGFIYFYEGDFELSINNFNKSVDKNTEDEGQFVIGILGLAQLAFAKRQYESALNYYKKALKINKALPIKARLGMAYCFYELEKFQLAKACFKRILDLQPNSVQAKIGWATLSFHQNNPQEYFRCLQQCYKHHPNHPLVILHVAQHLLLSKSIGKLPSLCQRGLNLLKQFPTFNDKSEQYRNDVAEYRCRFNHILGQLYHQSNEYETCVNYYSKAIHNNLLFVHINLAQVYTYPQMPMFEDAMKLLETAHQKIPSKYRRLLGETFKLLAYIKSKINKPLSYQLYQEAIKHNPDDFQSLIEYGSLTMDSDPKKCLSLYNAAYNVLLKKNMKTQPELFNNLAVVNMLNGNYKEAQKFIDMALQAVEGWKASGQDEPDIVAIKEKGFDSIFHFNRGIIYEEISKYEECQRDYNKVATDYPYMTDIYVRQALFELKKGNTAEALQKCSKGLKILSDYKMALRQAHVIELVKAYIEKVIGQERRAKSTLDKLKDRDCYARIFCDSLDFDDLMQKTDSNTVNIKESLKAKATSIVRVCQAQKHNMFAFMILAAMLAELGKLNQSLECFNHFKQFDDQHPQIMYNMGVLFYKMDRYDDAIMIWKKYIDKVGRIDGFKCQLSIAIVQFMQGKSTDAIRAIKKLVLLHPNNVLLRYNLSLFFQKTSEVNLDSKNKEIQQTKSSIAYLQRCYASFNHLSRISPAEYLNCIDNYEGKERFKSQLHQIMEKAEDQKLYIKSREQRFIQYERDAMTKQQANMDGKEKTLEKLQERRRLKQQQEMEEEMRQQEEFEAKRKAVLEEQKRREAQMNYELLKELEDAKDNKSKRVPKKKGTTKKEKNVKPDINLEDDIDDDYIVAVKHRRKEEGNKTLRLLKQNQAISSDQDQYPMQHEQQKPAEPQEHQEEGKPEQMEVEAPQAPKIPEGGVVAASNDDDDI